EAGLNGGYLAPGHDIVDEAVAAAPGKISLRIAQLQKIVLIVWQTWHVGLHILTRRGTRFCRIGLKDHRLGRGEQLSGPEDLACPMRMDWGHEVWMRTVGFVPCQG